MKVEKEYISDVITSEYEFWKDSKFNLHKNVNIRHLSVHGDQYMGWPKCSKVFYEELLKLDRELFCFISLNYWQLDNRIVRHLGLMKFLMKEYGVSELELYDKGYLLSGGRINFWGIIKLSNENYTDLLSLSDKLDTGIIFSSDNLQNDSRSVSSKLLNSLEFCDKSYTARLNKVTCINALTVDGDVAIYPYSDEELGDYYLDLFNESKRELGVR